METTIKKAGDIGQFVPMATSIALIHTKEDEEDGRQYLKSFLTVPPHSMKCMVTFPTSVTRKCRETNSHQTVQTEFELSFSRLF
jgi:hypothetical protein